MKDFLMKLGLSEGIAETILWWLPCLEVFAVIIAVVIIVKVIKKRRNSKK